MALNPFQMIFGGGNNTTQSTSTPSNMNPFTSSLAPQLMQLYGQGPMSYSGNLQPQMTGAQQGSLNNLPGMVAPTDQANSYINNVLSGSYMPGGAQGNPFIGATTQAAIAPIQNALETDINQVLPTQFAGQGQQVQGTGSSAFSNAKALAVGQAATAEAGAAAQIGSSAYNAGISQENTALTVQPQEVNSAINVLQAQLLPTLLQQQGITNGLQAFQDNVQSFLGFLQSMSGLAMPVIGNTQQSTGTTSSTPGILPDLTNLFKGSTSPKQSTT
jgi:hypothetical protein